MKQAEFKIKRTLICPTCGDDSKCAIDHLLDDPDCKSFGPWSCGICGMGINGVIHREHGKAFMEIEAIPPRSNGVKLMSLLVIPPQKEPMYFLKADLGYIRPGEAPHTALDRSYYFNEHSCPTNWFGDFETIQIGTDADPHGVIRFVRAMPKAAFDELEDKIREKWKMPRGRSVTDMDREIMETAFPEVAKRFVPTCDDFGHGEDEPDFVSDFDQDMVEVPEPSFRAREFYGTIDYYFAR